MFQCKYIKEYICHPYADDPEGNVEKVLSIVKSITEENKKSLENAKAYSIKTPEKLHIAGITVPIAVHLLFPRFMSEDTFGREMAMEFCLSVLEGCDRIIVFGPNISKGMRQEISFAGEKGIEIGWCNFDRD